MFFGTESTSVWGLVSAVILKMGVEEGRNLSKARVWNVLVLGN